MGPGARTTRQSDGRAGRSCLRQRLWELLARCLRRTLTTPLQLAQQHHTEQLSTDSHADAIIHLEPREPLSHPTPTSKLDDQQFPRFPHVSSAAPRAASVTMALDNYYHNKIEAMKLEILKGQAVLRRLEAQRNDYNSRVRLLREELGLLQQPGSYVGEVVKVMGTKKVLVKVHPEGKYGMGFRQRVLYL